MPETLSIVNKKNTSELSNLLSEIEDQFVSVPQAAKILGYQRHHTAYLVRSGRIKAAKVGHRYLVPKSALLLFSSSKSTH